MMNEINTKKKMMKCITKILTNKKKYISDLCGFYGNPYGVRDHLNELMNSNAILSKVLKTDVERLDKEIEDEEKEYLEELKLSEIDKQYAGCRNCAYGNGEGGCTVPNADCCHAM